MAGPSSSLCSLMPGAEVGELGEELPHAACSRGDRAGLTLHTGSSFAKLLLSSSAFTWPKFSCFFICHSLFVVIGSESQRCFGRTK